MSIPATTSGGRLSIFAAAILALCACSQRPEDEPADHLSDGSTGSAGAVAGDKGAGVGTTKGASGGATGKGNGPGEGKSGGSSNAGGFGEAGRAAGSFDSGAGRGEKGGADGGTSGTRDPSGGTSKTADASGARGNAPDASAETATSDAGVDARTRVLCVFDYDLVLSTHDCDETQGDPSCRVADCSVYGWSDQCIAKHAREAVAECVRRKAYLGIASHSLFEACWNDKIVPMVSEHQFPELTDSPYYDKRGSEIAYPAVDKMENWNCADCAYHMGGPQVSKPSSIAKIMRHYGLDPDKVADRKRVLFWDDDPKNINDVEAAMPEILSVPVRRHGDAGAQGGCGIRLEDVEKGWSQVE